MALMAFELLLLGCTHTLIADEKSAPIAPALVVMTGEANGFRQFNGGAGVIMPGEDVQQKVAESLRSVTVMTLRLDEKTGIVVVLPVNVFNLNDVFKTYNKPVAVEGILTSTDKAVSNLKCNRGSRNEPRELVSEKASLGSSNGRRVANFSLGTESQRWHVILRWKSGTA